MSEYEHKRFLDLVKVGGRQKLVKGKVFHQLVVFMYYGMTRCEDGGRGDGYGGGGQGGV